MDSNMKNNKIEPIPDVNSKNMEKGYRHLLAPRLLCESDAAYKCVEELAYAVAQPECRNIALTGVFGSGKSSVIDTYLKLESAPQKVLRISLSNFEDYLNEKITSDNASYENCIEYKIFQHILYKANIDKTQCTRFRRLHITDSEKIKKFCKRLLLFFLCFVIAFEPNVFQIDSIYTAYHFVFGALGDAVNVISDIIACLIMLWLLYKFMINAVHIFSVTSIHRFKAKDFEVELDNDKSVFNQILDEILYFFKAGEYNAVIFEDLDRINKPSKLFLKFREINLLLNESDYFESKDKQIKFIYAIKDDIFNGEVRTKFFDYIVPVVPVVDSFNAGEYLLKNYKDVLKGINDSDVKRLGLFITKMRELVNTMNEYQLYKKVILKEPMSKKKLLAITIYKNLYPEDYSKIHSKEGFLYFVFANKKIFSKPLTNEKKNTINKISNDIKSEHEKITKNRKKILDWFNTQFNISIFVIKGIRYNLDEIALSDSLYNNFQNDKIEAYIIDHPEMPDYAEYNDKYKDVISKVDPEGSISKEIQNSEKIIISSQNIKAYLEKEVNRIESKSLKDLMCSLGDGNKSMALIKEIYAQYKEKDETIKRDTIVETVHGLIRNDYISEDYGTYITYTYTGSFGEKEFEFQQSVLQGIPLPFDFKLDHIDSVIDGIYSDNYENRSILNFDLLNYLLKYRTNSRLDNFIKTARQNPDFIIGYDSQNNINEVFFNLLFKDWDGCGHI